MEPSSYDGALFLIHMGSSHDVVTDLQVVSAQHVLLDLHVLLCS